MQYLEIGKIVNTHGLDGEVKVICNYYGKNFPNWSKNTNVFLKDNDNFSPLIINSVRKHQQFLLVSFNDFNNINMVEPMKSKPLMIAFDENNKGNLPWFYENIINYQVFDNSNNELLGQVVAFFDNNHQGLWEIKNSNHKTFFIPNNRAFIIKIDPEQQSIFINVIEGLINND